MKTKKKWIIAIGSILLLPLIFAASMNREVAGSVTIYTVRGTPLRLYLSDAGSLAFACRTEEARLNLPRWYITRANKVAWTVVNVGALYIAFPFLMTDIFIHKT